MELTSRQWQLYNLLKTQTDHWFSQKEICDSVSGYEYVDRNNDKCPAIRDDKNALNESPIIDKIIVMKNYCFKIGTLEEYKEERLSHIRRLKNQVKMIEDMDKKFSRNGQGKLFNNILEELKDNNEQFHETFIEPKHEFKKEINGVKVYTRVVYSIRNRIAYFITAKHITINDDIVSQKGIAICQLANGDYYQVKPVEFDTYSPEIFETKEAYKDFEREYIE